MYRYHGVVGTAHVVCHGKNDAIEKIRGLHLETLRINALMMSVQCHQSYESVDRPSFRSNHPAFVCNDEEVDASSGADAGATGARGSIDRLRYGSVPSFLNQMNDTEVPSIVFGTVLFLQSSTR